MAGLLSNLDRDSPGKRAERDDAHAKRVAAQQFLNHHAPLLKVYLAWKLDPSAIAHPGAFADNALLARRLAVEIAAHVLEKPAREVTMTEARAYRVEAAEIVASFWAIGESINVQETAAELAAAVRQADPDFDGRDLNFGQMTPDGLFSLSAVTAVSKLLPAVQHYNFRLGENLILSSLMTEITGAVARAVQAVAPPAASSEDRRSLTQTLTRTFSDMMGSIYGAEAHEALDAISTFDEPQIRAWLRENNCLERIIGRFRAGAEAVTHIAAAAARATADASRATNDMRP